LTRGRGAWKLFLGVLTFLVVLRARPSETLLEFLAMFIKQRGRRTGICAFDRHGGLAQLSVSAFKGVDREEQEKMQLPSLQESCAPFFRVGVVKRVDVGQESFSV
jgi:hypothetical protein